MSVHLRSCIHKRKKCIRRNNTVVLDLPPIQLCHTPNRLQCDGSTFDRFRLDSTVCHSSDLSEHHTNIPLIETASEAEISSTDKQNKDSKTKLLLLRLARLCRKTVISTVNEIVEILVHPGFAIHDLRKNCRKAKDCINVENVEVEQTLQGCGFDLQIVKDSPEICYAIFTCDPLLTYFALRLKVRRNRTLFSMHLTSRLILDGSNTIR